MKKKYKSYEIFIEGETINLCIPSIKAITYGNWASWFNNFSILQSTRHGIYPNSIANQKKILNEIEIRKDLLVLLIVDKISFDLCGVISLQDINLNKKSAEWAIMIGNKKGLTSKLAPLEATAFLFQHGFKEMGLRRIYCGQRFPMLTSWIKKCESLGSKTEGIERSSFVRGQDISDVAISSCLVEDFKKIISVRNGHLWPGTKKMEKILNKMPKKTFAEIFKKKFTQEEKLHFKTIFKTMKN